MSEIEPGTIQDLLAELVACAGVFDVSTNYEADKVSLEKATQAVLDHVQTLRDERDRLREALRPFAERWEYFERTKHPSGGEWPEDLEYADDEPSAIYLGQLKAAKAALTPAGGRAGMSSVEEQIGSAAWETAPVWCRIAIVAMEQALRDCDILARRKMGKDATWGHIRRFCNQAGVNSEKGVLK